jgi:hypothetical protein
MKKYLLPVMLLILTVSVEAQKSEPKRTEKSKLQYSLMWGLIKSKNYSKATPVSFKADYSQPAIAIDTNTHEMKSYLWGAVQWSAKKKTKTQQNGK